MNIYEKLLAISSEMERVNKNLSVGFGKSSYKAVGEADVLAAVKPLEEKYKVYSYPFARRIVDSGTMTNTTEYQGNVTEKTQLYLRIEVTYRFVNVEKPDEYVDITSYGDGVDSQDKAVGKAMTYADKYALMKCYRIMTGDDPDQNMSQPLKSVKREKISKADALALTSLLENDNNRAIIMRKFNVASLEDLTKEQYAEAVRVFKASKEKKK